MSLALLHDLELYGPAFLRVKDPVEARIVPLRPKPVQRQIRTAITTMRAQGKPVRIMVLKFRRGGVSTEVAGEFFHRVATRPYQRCQVLAHRGPDAKTIFKIYERMYEHLPESVNGLPLKPRRAGGKSKEMIFPGIDSSIEVGSAGSADLGRGGDVQLLHLSEAAYFKNAETFLSGLLPQLPATGDNVAIFESTGDGSKPFYKDLWQRSKDGLSGFLPLFFAWHEDPTNRMPQPLDEEEWTEEERELHERYAVDGAQLAWLRFKLETEAFGDLNRRRQIYPSCEDDCWVSVGKAPWDYEQLLKCFQRQPPLWRGEITERGITKDPEGRLYVWEDPVERKDVDYVLGVDVASELETGEADLCAVTVWRVGKQLGQWPVQVASWSGNLDAYSYAQMLTLLGHYYKRGLLSVEINGIGRPVQNLLQKNFYYPRLYRYRRFDAYKVAKDTWGWQTTDQTMDAMLGIADWLIRCGKTVIRDPQLLDELLNYRQVGPGRYEGMHGDDRIMSTFIAWTTWLQDICSGTPMSEIRKLLARMYGGTDVVETVEPPASARPAGADVISEGDVDDLVMPAATARSSAERWVPSGRRRATSEAHF